MASRRALVLVPLGVAALAGGGFWTVLRRMQAGTFDPRATGHPLIGKPAPAFVLPGLSSADLRAVGKPALVNFFASWCAPCIVEAPVLATLKDAPLFGIAYKDAPDATDRFLARHGNPYGKLGRDQAGLTGIDWGTTGVPETFLVDPGGIVRWHYAAPLTETVVTEQVRPALAAG